MVGEEHMLCSKKATIPWPLGILAIWNPTHRSAVWAPKHPAPAELPATAGFLSETAGPESPREFPIMQPKAWTN